MPNWFYTDANGQKQGPVTNAQFGALVKQGVITPETVVADERGKFAPARKVKGLVFPEPAEQLEINNFCAEHGTDVKAADKKGLTLLHKAAAFEGIFVLKFLVSQGADIHAKTDRGLTPLHLAVSCNSNDEVAKFLVSKGADVNAKGKNGETPLQLATQEGKSEMVALLLQLGAERQEVNPFALPVPAASSPFTAAVPQASQAPPVPVVFGVPVSIDRLFSLVDSIAATVAKKTSVGISCADCGCELGLLNKNYVDSLPEAVRQGKAALCGNCVRKYTITCADCGIVWNLDPERKTLRCPKCSGRICSDCHKETEEKSNAVAILPKDLRQGKACICPDCAKKYTITCEKCGFDWHLDFAQGVVACPVCCLTDAVGFADIRSILASSKPFWSRIPQIQSPDEILDVVGVVYRRGHPHYLDPMGGFLVLTETRLYFLGTNDPDSPQISFRDIRMPFSSISAVSALSEGVHSNSSAFYNGWSKKLASVADIAGTVIGLAAIAVPGGMAVGRLAGQAASRGLRGASGPPPKNRLTIGYKELGRLTVVFDILDVTNENITKTAAAFRAHLLGYSSEFEGGKKSDTSQQATASQPAGEKFRIFRAGQLLSMITTQEIEARYAAKTLQQTDFVLLPLKTFLAEIAVPDKPFQLFRDGKRIDQYTLQQIKELHGGGQTQEIDHVLLPLPIYLTEKSTAQTKTDVYGVQS